LQEAAQAREAAYNEYLIKALHEDERQEIVSLQMEADELGLEADEIRGHLKEWRAVVRSYEDLESRFDQSEHRLKGELVPPIERLVVRYYGVEEALEAEHAQLVEAHTQWREETEHRRQGKAWFNPT